MTKTPELTVTLMGDNDDKMPPQDGENNKELNRINADNSLAKGGKTTDTDFTSGLTEDDEETDRNARRAYSAYGSATDYKNYQGLPMPSYDDLGDVQKKGWRAVAALMR